MKKQIIELNFDNTTFNIYKDSAIQNKRIEGIFFNLRIVFPILNGLPSELIFA